MKIDRRRALASLIFFGLAAFAGAESSSRASAKTNIERELNAAKVLDTAKTITGKTTGTEHAPVDGKDGIPKEGPWVETNAERQRKKTSTNSYYDEEDDDDDDTHKSKTGPSNKWNSAPDIPQSNDGVMDDKSRPSPKEGTRGTEDGISQKNKNKDETTEEGKRPETPKEKRPLPHSEKEKMKATGTAKDDDDATDEIVITNESSRLFEKPSDLPDLPHSKPYSDSLSSSKSDESYSDEERASHRSSGRISTTGEQKEKEDIVQPLHSMFLAFMMIMFSEIGDKTFLVACLMAMRHDRLLVFSAAYSALVAMTVLSAVLGHAVPTLIPKWLTNFLAAGLFLVFGIKMLLEARNISPDEGVSEEMKEVEQELEEKEHQALRRSRRRSSISPYVLEAGRGGIRKHRSSTGRLPSPPESPSSESSSRSGSPSRRSSVQTALDGLHNLFSLILSPAWVQTFVMTFLGEWGDRSQIATIAMAAGSDYWWVTAGALIGHAICTGMAVIGGKAIAGKVSLRTITMGGAIAFLVFGVIYLLEALY